MTQNWGKNVFGPVFSTPDDSLITLGYAHIEYIGAGAWEYISKEINAKRIKK